MTKSLKDYIAYYKPTYEFVIKSRIELTAEMLKKFLEETDLRYEIAEKSEIKRNGFRKDIDFSGDDITETWDMTISYKYPVDDRTLESIFVDTVYLPQDAFIIRKSKSAEIIDSDKRAEEPEEKEPLLTSEIKPLEDVKAEELYGDEYNEKMVKELSSDELKIEKEYKVSDK